MIDLPSRQADPEIKRRWRIPPPLLRDPGALGPEGMNILKELPDELGGVLWKSVRNVLVWGDVSPGDRANLFPEGAHERRQADILAADPPEELAIPLDEIARLLAEPETVDPERVGLACARVARWAQKEEKPLTATEFLQAAAVACPADPRYALEVARAARDRAQYGRAEAWLHRTVGLGRRARDWDAYIRAYIALGKMMQRRGAYPAAHRSFTKGLRRAVRQGHRETEAMALHDLFVLEADRGNWEEAQGYAARAVRAYGKKHRHLPALAHDIAYGWVQTGQHEHALPVFHAVLPHLEAKRHRVPVFGSIARSSGALGDQDGFEWARKELHRLGKGPGVSEAWTDVARGAAALARWEEAEEAARHSEALAAERKESKITFTARSILETVASERKAAAAMSEPRTDARRTTPADELARNLVRWLQASPVGAGDGA